MCFGISLGSRGYSGEQTGSIAAFPSISEVGQCTQLCESTFFYIRRVIHSPSPHPHCFLGRPTRLTERSLSPRKFSGTARYERELCKASQRQCRRILRGSSFLGAAGRAFAPHPCSPAMKRVRVTFEDHCIPDGGWGQGSLLAVAEVRLVLMGWGVVSLCAWESNAIH